jgi:DNA-binding CsgD family transcriptional regulator
MPPPPSPLISSNQPPAPLSTREHEFLKLLSTGKLYKEIQDKMNVSHGVLRKIQKSCYRKLESQNRTEASNAWRLGNYDWAGPQL